MEGKAALVTGGTGFVGSHLVEYLLANGYDTVKCLVRKDPKWLEGLDVEIMKGSLQSVSAMKNAVRGVEYVYHVGGLTRSTLWDDFYDANVVGTTNLLQAVHEAAPYVRKVLVTGSLAAVGHSDIAVPDEDVPLRPFSMYGRSKAEMETAVAEWHDRLPITMVRPPAVYGPRESDIFTFFKMVSKGLCPIVGDGEAPTLSLVYVSDLVRGMVDAAESTATVGKTYFIGSEKQYSWNEIRDATIEAMDRKVFTINVPERFVKPVGAWAERLAGLVGKYPPLNREKAKEILEACKMCSSERAMTDFGYEQRMPLDLGIRRTIAWYRDKGWL